MAEGAAESVRPVVWVPRPIDDAVVESLAVWADVRLGWGATAASWADVAPEVQGVLLRTARVDGAMMREAPGLRIVARHGVGLDTVDVAAAAELDIEVTTTPAANSRSVAELAVALLMVTRRGLGPALASASAGADAAPADRASMTGRELAGATLGLLGYGRIAQVVAGIARDGLGMRVVAHDPHLGDDAIREAGAEPAGLDDLLRASDALSVHVPLTDATRGLISARELALLPAGAVVVNTSRGGVVDEEALVAALESGYLAGAGLDVTSVEPLPGDHPLRHRPDVVLTPHVGGQTREAMSRVGHEAAAHLRRSLLPPR
ncbi:D-3-phosphoglycerate dehydrogenase/(S)-sulfolactate dehydrogenase [Frigoribacterium sp. PhB107]|uniref:NAD(P)-dependent oxidoreductase n=1 Tax=Frigoribacterium sp. PhB107 TaxID=2485172 RepID=UPI000FAE4A46|nr:NAD(P)-dependent oxidoreductase [Frigoribacterium sp. PhB107]ROP77425.1 D-3-phosphoglycerate dehydrogenase/(S)-sulfolactate dehydrogenase [Frigoribacterium sp. PhB107]